MPNIASLAMVILGLLLFGYVLRLVSLRKILLGYSLLWFLLATILIICPLFPNPIYQLAHLFGIELPSNFIFMLAIVCLLAISLSLSVIVSRQTAYQKTLVQEVALLNKELDSLKAKK